LKGVLSKYIALESSQRSFLNKACFQLAGMRIALSVCPFKKLVIDLQVQSTEPDLHFWKAHQLSQARLISWAISAAAAHLPWNSSCLVQALAAQRMLQRRGIPGVLHLGAALGSAETARVRLAAHAWVKSGGEFIIGEQGSMSCKSMAAYAWT
jgi:hypothetical protein